jgi:hypothetical protein
MLGQLWAIWNGRWRVAESFTAPLNNLEVNLEVRLLMIRAGNGISSDICKAQDAKVSDGWLLLTAKRSPISVSGLSGKIFGLEVSGRTVFVE